MLLHVVLARIAFHSPAVGHLVKGRERRLVASGRILPDAMRRDGITPHDLAEALRLQASTDEVEGLEAVYLERSGDISVIRA